MCQEDRWTWDRLKETPGLLGCVTGGRCFTEVLGGQGKPSAFLDLCCPWGLQWAGEMVPGVPWLPRLGLYACSPAAEGQEDVP